MMKTRNKNFTLLFVPFLMCFVWQFPMTQVMGQKSVKSGSIKSINFNNRTYRIPGETIKLKSGKYKNADFRYILESKKYKDFDGDKSDEVLITIQKTTKGLVGRYRIYLIYTFKKGNLKLLFGQIRPRGDAARINDKKIILTGFFWSKSDPDCCPSQKETEVYEWSKKRRMFLLKDKKSKKV